MEKEVSSKENQHIGDHLANERTFLAWVRTSIGIMGFGFVVVKFSLFIRQIAVALDAEHMLPRKTSYSQLIGILLVALGGMIIILAYFRYRKIQRQLQIGEFRQSDLLIKISTGLISIGCVFLLIYLYWN